VKPTIPGLIEKLPLLVVDEQPAILSWNGPVEAAAGMVATSWLDAGAPTGTDTPFKVSWSYVDSGLKLVPLIVTCVPPGPLVGVKDVMVGGPATVKLLTLEAPGPPSTVSWIAPLVAQGGTMATSCVVLALVAGIEPPLIKT